VVNGIALRAVLPDVVLARLSQGLPVSAVGTRYELAMRVGQWLAVDEILGILESRLARGGVVVHAGNKLPGTGPVEDGAGAPAVRSLADVAAVSLDLLAQRTIIEMKSIEFGSVAPSGRWRVAVS